MRLPTKEELIAVDSQRKTDFCNKLGIDPSSLASVIATMENADSQAAQDAVAEIKQLEEILGAVPRFTGTQILMMQIGPKGWSSLLTDLCAVMLQTGYNMGQSDALELIGGMDDTGDKTGDKKDAE